MDDVGESLAAPRQSLSGPASEFGDWLSGEFRVEHIYHLKAEIERCDPRLALNLEEVDLADVEVVRFLNACQSGGHPNAALLGPYPRYSLRL
jgi:hypothetical protein